MENFSVYFYIWGMVTHVGQCFNGLNAAVVATSLAIYFCEKEKIDINIVELYDLKAEYNVQTPANAFLVLEISSSLSEKVAIPEMIDRAVELLFTRIRRRYFQYCEQTGISYFPLSIPVRIVEYLPVVCNTDIENDMILEQMKMFHKKMDDRLPAVLYYIEEKCERNSRI